MTETIFYGAVLQATAGTNDDLDDNIADDGTQLTRYISLNPSNVLNGRLMYVKIYLDNANSRAFDLVLASGSSSTANTQLAKYIFQSDQWPAIGDQGIDDATLESFELDRPFKLDEAGRMYHTLYSSAGAFGNVSGYLIVRGIAYI